MKKLTLFFAFFLFLKTVSPSFAEWTLVYTGSDGVKNYVDFKNISVSKNYIYVWDLRDEVKPLYGKYLSSSVLYEVDCTIPRSKTLSYVWYTENMGNGIAEQEDSAVKDWKYSTPSSYMFKVLKSACDFVKSK